VEQAEQLADSDEDLPADVDLDRLAEMHSQRLHAVSRFRLYPNDGRNLIRHSSRAHLSRTTHLALDSGMGLPDKKACMAAALHPGRGQAQCGNRQVADGVATPATVRQEGPKHDPKQDGVALFTLGGASVDNPRSCTGDNVELVVAVGGAPFFVSPEEEQHWQEQQEAAAAARRRAEAARLSSRSGAPAHPPRCSCSLCLSGDGHSDAYTRYADNDDDNDDGGGGGGGGGVMRGVASEEEKGALFDLYVSTGGRRWSTAEGWPQCRRPSPLPPLIGVQLGLLGVVSLRVRIDSCCNSNRHPYPNPNP
jgi:hypothetical protein